jgi:predicted dienelactone hydrolase
VIVMVVAAIVAASCSSEDSSEPTTTSTTTSSVPEGVPEVSAGPDDAAFREPGPYEVGVTTLQLSDRSVEVWYPAEDGASEGQEPASYSQLDALPPDLAAAAPSLLPADVPPSVLDVEMTDTYRDVAAAPDGPFPLVLFSHGFGSYRLDASALVRGIASWGFVVAAPDHIERNRGALLTGEVVRDPEKDVSVLMDTISLVGDAGGELEGLTDTELVAAVGHSAGGRAALSALSEPQVDVAVGWAAAGRADVPAPDKPSMNIAALVDVLVPIEEVAQTYEGMATPKRFVVIDGAGHNSFTDICLSVKGGTDLIGLAQRIGLGIPDNLAAGGRDGCEEGSIDTREGWEITQHFTVAQIREAFGVGDGTGLGQDVTAQFDVPIDYTQDLG